jgi:hypothetical protein
MRLPWAMQVHLKLPPIKTIFLKRGSLPPSAARRGVWGEAKKAATIWFATRWADAYFGIRFMIMPEIG